MFTGLIEEIGRVELVSRGRLVIKCSTVVADTKLGDSIAVNGVCLSVTKILPNALEFHVSETTMAHTRLSSNGFSIAEEVNLERAMTLAQRLGGHIVTGHVDGKARIVEISKLSDDRVFEFMIPSEIRSFIVNKGSVAIDGISPTICEVRSSSFLVTVIPQTLEKTNLKKRRIGDRVHIEADILARYAQNSVGFDTNRNTSGRTYGIA